jgi:hypothetical protein
VSQLDEERILNCWINLPQKRLLVLGCPRSGTRYTARLLKTGAGLDVPHERMGQHGTVTSFFAADMPSLAKPHKGVRSDYEFEHVWHIVRHPLMFVRSAFAFLDTGYWETTEPHTGVHVPLRENGYPSEDSYPALGLHWVRWNRLIETQKPEMRYRLERTKTAWPVMMDLLGLNGTVFPSNVKPVGRDTDTLTKTSKVTWDMFGEHQAEVWDLAASYGYYV